MQRLKEIFFQNRSTRQTIAKNVFWLSVSQLGSRLIRAAIIIYAARVLGAAEYGLFSYALGFAGFFTVFSDIGVGQIMTREAAKNPSMRSYYFSTSFWIKVPLLFLVALVIIFLTPYLLKIENINFFIPLIALLVVFDGLREFSTSFFRALEKMEWEAITTTLTNLIVAASGFIVLYLSSSSIVLMTAYTLSVGAGAIAAIFVIRGEFYKIRTHYKKELVKPIVKSALPIALSSSLGAFMLNTDLIMLGWWVMPKDIGYYSAGQKVVQLLYTLPAILASAIFPTLSRLIGQRDNEKIKELMEKSLSLIYLFAIPMILGGVILAKPLVGFLYGAEYLPAVFNFQVLLVTLFLVFPGVLLGNSAIAHDKQKELTKYLLLAAISNIIFNAIFIPRFGIVGSAYSTIIALSIDVGLVWRMLKKVNNFYVLGKLGKIVVASLVMGASSIFFYYLGINIVLNIIFSAIIYFGTLLLFKEKAVDEIFEMVRRVR